MAQEAFRLEHLSFTYPGGSSPALADLSLTLEKGQFITLCGPSGCGKTTLLRQLKTVLAPHGTRRGTITFEGAPLDGLDQRTQSEKIGFVLQSPENQIVTDKVWHELAFGLEGLGYDRDTIRLRVAEMASFFGIQSWFYETVTALSGGQKQLLNLAAVMAMQPSVLILDEPTSQLDPIAAADFLATVGRINRELGVTVLLTEHRLEDALPLSDRCIVLDCGRVIADGAPADVGEQLRSQGHRMFLSMPTPMRVWAGVENCLPCPITVRDGRDWLTGFDRLHPVERLLPPAPPAGGGAPAICLDGVWFRYEKDGADVVKGLCLSVPAGQFCALVGGNGTGKTTTLSLISGLHRPYRGTVCLDGRPLDKISESERFGGLLGVLPQNPQALFVKKTVALDLAEMLTDSPLSKGQRASRVAAVAALCALEGLLERHPYDLSGGEQQRAALAKVLLANPKILLLDEPTKGMDSAFKVQFAHILKQLQGCGTTILVVSHDIEFCCRYADRCAMVFDGGVVTDGPPRTFFSGNSFYTTAANRMARHLIANAVTAEDVISACGGTLPPEVPPPPPSPPGDGPKPPAPPAPPARWRRPLALLLLALAGVLAYVLVGHVPVGLGFGPAVPLRGWSYAGGAMLMALCAGGGLTLLSVFKRAPLPPERVQQPPDRRKLTRRTRVAAAVILLLVPLTVFVGVAYLDNRKYYFISLLVLLETMVPFFLVFEHRKPQARTLIILAVLCAIGVAGRQAFFFAPQFKPVAALVIVTAVAFGGESGFVVGAMTMLLSNLYYTQGPWTPWQMCAMGGIGFLAGVLFQKGVLRRERTALCVFGFLSVFLLYGFIMNASMVFLYQEKPTLSMLWTYCLLGMPMDLVHASATAFFLWLAGPALLEKLDRVKTKYGLLDC